MDGEGDLSVRMSLTCWSEFIRTNPGLSRKNFGCLMSIWPEGTGTALPPVQNYRFLGGVGPIQKFPGNLSMPSSPSPHSPCRAKTLREERHEEAVSATPLRNRLRGRKLVHKCNRFSSMCIHNQYPPSNQRPESQSEPKHPP